MIATLKDAAAKLTGAKRRAFQAQVTRDYLNGSLRQAERVFGWGRQTERCWGSLENHWNGTLLDSVATALNWASTMTWKALLPVVRLLENTYEKGVRVARKLFQKVSQRLMRDATLPKYFVRISPKCNSG